MPKQWKDANGNDLKIWQSRFKVKLAIEHRLGGKLSTVQLDFGDPQELREISNELHAAAMILDDKVP